MLSSTCWKKPYTKLAENPLHSTTHKYRAPLTVHVLQAKTIETPAFREITAEDRNDWVALRARQREHEQQRELRKEGKDVPMDGFESSSSEDTSDEKYYRLHSVEEAKEKAFDSEPHIPRHNPLMTPCTWECFCTQQHK